MTDRFKFRLWAKDIEMYFEKPLIYINTDGKLVAEDGIKVYEIDQKAYIIEQCTGLKDKNGKLIYEGDIVKLSSDREVVCLVVWDNEETGFCVEYKKELYRFNTYKKYHLIEVIGNIHENADLLGEDKWHT